MGFTAELGAGMGGILQVGGNSRSRGALRESRSGTFEPCALTSCIPLVSTFAQFLFASVVLNHMPSVLTRVQVISLNQAYGDFWEP